MKDLQGKEVKEGKKVVFSDKWGELILGKICRVVEEKDSTLHSITIERDDNLGLYTRELSQIAVVD